MKTIRDSSYTFKLDVIYVWYRILKLTIRETMTRPNNLYLIEFVILHSDMEVLTQPASFNIATHPPLTRLH